MELLRGPVGLPGAAKFKLQLRQGLIEIAAAALLHVKENLLFHALLG
jgi:hypothetical protein